MKNPNELPMNELFGKFSAFDFATPIFVVAKNLGNLEFIVVERHIKKHDFIVKKRGIQKPYEIEWAPKPGRINFCFADFDSEDPRFEEGPIFLGICFGDESWLMPDDGSGIMNDYQLFCKLKSGFYLNRNRPSKFDHFLKSAHWSSRDGIPKEVVFNVNNATPHHSLNFDNLINGDKPSTVHSEEYSCGLILRQYDSSWDGDPRISYNKKGRVNEVIRRVKINSQDGDIFLDFRVFDDGYQGDADAWYGDRSD